MKNAIDLMEELNLTNILWKINKGNVFAKNTHMQFAKCMFKLKMKFRNFIHKKQQIQQSAISAKCNKIVFQGWVLRPA